MYDNIKHAGIPLSEWQKIFSNQFTLGELYQMHIGKMPWPASKMEVLRARVARLGNS